MNPITIIVKAHNYHIPNDPNAYYIATLPNYPIILNHSVIIPKYPKYNYERFNN